MRFWTIWAAFWLLFSSILAACGNHLGVLGEPSGRQRGSQKRVKWGLGARVAPGGFGDSILEDFGSLLDSPGALFGEILERFPWIFRGFPMLFRV